MWVESVPGAGSRFFFTARFALSSGVLTADEETARRESSDGLGREPLPAGSASPCSALSILLVEDDPVNQLLVVRVLENAGHRMSVARDGAQALAAIRRERFDLVLVDVQMPVFDGLEATVTLREEERASGGHRTPVIAMTASTMLGDRERCLAAGMDDYISKPIDIEQFRAMVERVKTRSAAGGPSGRTDQ